MFTEVLLRQFFTLIDRHTTVKQLHHGIRQSFSNKHYSLIAENSVAKLSCDLELKITHLNFTSPHFAYIC